MSSKMMKAEIRANCTKLTKGTLSVYLLNLKDAGTKNLHKKDFGKPSSVEQRNKTIMLLGATGSGKSTLINGMVNYIMGVEWNDQWRLKLINKQTNKSQDESQTSEVTAYQIHHQNHFQVPYSLTIIDTPGFGDTKGISHDKEITEKIRKFFSEQDGILGLDGVCFVVQSTLAQLTPSQRYIFDAILSIFGKDIADNITIMITFADGQKPPVLDAIDAADIPCVKKPDGSIFYFKFNDSALFAQQQDDEDDEDNFDEMFWKMGKTSMKTFFTHLEKMETKSLQLTNEVLSERKQLEATVTRVQRLIQTGLANLDQIKMKRAALDQNQNIIKGNENFEYEVDEMKYKQVDLDPGAFVTNCLQCNFTCHYPCGIPDDKDKINCSAMKNGNCTVCPKRCIWNVHRNMTYRIEIITVREKNTYAKLKATYEEALGKKMSIEKIMAQLEMEYEDLQESVLQMSDDLAKSLTRLKEIALRPDPLSTSDYIELLIESERQEGKEAFMKRIKELEELKTRALIMQKVEKGELLTEEEKSHIKKKTIGQRIKDIYHQNKMSSKTLLTEIRENCTELTKGTPSVYLLNLMDAGTKNLPKKDFGKPSKAVQRNKTIMLLGATGSGKSTLINGMVNYIMGAEWNDQWRLKLINKQTNKSQAESQTSEVTAYQIHHQNHFQVPYSLTIIDTPGFGDTKGISHDKEITEKIRQFFSEQDGILGLDAVCFVVQSALAQLTPSQRYIFDAILSIFGKDIADNITIMITFADGQKPPVLDAIDAADIPCVRKPDGSIHYFKFNNSALFAHQQDDEDDEDNFDEMFWKMGKTSMKRFFTHLETMETKSLQLTNEVLSERKQLEATVTRVQRLVQTGLANLDKIKMKRAALDQNQNIIKENENFEYEVDEMKYNQVNLATGTFVTNCLQCNFTCHDNCAYSDDKDKKHCCAMKNGNCTVCPKRCIWNVHRNMTYRIEIITVREKRTYANLKATYEEALGKKMSIEKIMAQLEKEYEDLQETVLQMSDVLAESLTRLKEIALRPDPLSTSDYIELLIESERQEGKEGHMKRIKELEELRGRALILQKIERGEPLTEEENSLSTKKTTDDKIKGVFYSPFHWFKNN